VAASAEFGGKGMTRKFVLGLAFISIIVGGGTAFGWDPDNEKRAISAIDDFKRVDPGMDSFFNTAYGYVVFPKITKAGIGIGGAGGDGTVFEAGNSIGSSSMTQLSVGLQLGGQTYREAIFFKDKAALENFKQGNYEVAAGLSAVAAKSGASKTADYNHGVAIFTMGESGLMFEASVGGQKFSYEPK